MSAKSQKDNEHCNLELLKKPDLNVWTKENNSF